MISVTDGAKAELKRILLLCNDHQETGIRLILSPPDQFSLILDMEVDSDQVVEYEGEKVLLVGRELYSLIRGVTIALESTDSKRELVMYWRDKRKPDKNPGEPNRYL